MRNKYYFIFIENILHADNRDLNRVDLSCESPTGRERKQNRPQKLQSRLSVTCHLQDPL